jgi:transposase
MQLQVPHSIDVDAFRTFFNHEGNQGERMSIVQRSALLTLHVLQYSNAQIAHLTHCDERVIQHWVTQYEQHGSLQDLPRSGRPRITTQNVDQEIVDFARETPVTTPRVVRSELGVKASARTVRRRLDEVGLFGRLARVEFPLTEEHIRKRLDFAHTYKHWTEAQWECVAFGDESYIHLGYQGQVWVQRPSDMAFMTQYMVSGHTQFAPKIGMWGCFSAHGIGPMRSFDDNMDSRLYTDTMQRMMKPHSRSLWPNQQWFYLQDNAAYHASTVSTTWFHNHGIDVLPFPPHSPDLNPIENLWAVLKRRIDAHNASTIEDLRAIISSEWAAMTDDFCARLAHSMPQRLQAVIEANGHRTRY